MIAYDPRLSFQRNRRGDLIADLPPEFYAWENRDNFAECGADLLTLWCGDKWKNLREFGPGDPFDFRVVSIDYLPFEKKWLYYTGKSRGLMGSPRYDVMKHLLPWWWHFATPNLLKIVPEMDGGTLRSESETAEEDLQLLPLNMKWIATYNYARVLDLERQARAAGVRQLKSVQLTIF